MGNLLRRLAGAESVKQNEQDVFAGLRALAADNSGNTQSAILAQAGKIGGWNLGNMKLFADNGNAVLDGLTPAFSLGGTSGYLTGTGLWAGKSSNVYKLHIGNPAGNYLAWDNSTLTIVGTITATSGTIGGWTIGATTLTGGSITLNSATPAILVGSATDYLTGAGVFIGLSGGAYKMHIGNPAGTRLAWDASTLSLSTGALNVALAEWTTSIVFSSTDNDTVSWTSGTIQIQTGATYAIDAGNTGNMVALTYIYLDTAVSTTVLQTTATYSTAVGDGKILIAAAQNGTVGASVIPFGGQQPIISGGQIINNTILPINVNSALQSWTTSVAFSSASATQINWGTGTITLADGTSYSIASGNTGTMSALTYIYLAPAVSTTVLQTTTTYSTAVGTGKILIAAAQNNSVGASCIPLSGQQPIVDGSQINALSIVAGNIAAATITGAKMVAGTITATQIATGTITANEIAASTITGAKIAANTIAAGNIVANTITTNEIASLTILASNIAAGTITGAKIAATTITAANIAAGTITATQLSATAIDAMTVTGATIRTAASPAARVEMNSTLLAGYSDATTKQFYLQASDGKAYAGAGNVILDADGVHVTPTSSYTASRAYFFTNIGGLYGYYDSGVVRRLKLESVTTGASEASSIHIVADAEHSGAIASISLIAADNGVTQNYLSVTKVDTTISLGLNIGTATGAGTGDVYGSGELNMAGTGTHYVMGAFGIGMTPGVILDVKGADNGTAALRLYKGSNQVVWLGTGSGTAGDESGYLQLNNNAGNAGIVLDTQGPSYITSGSVVIGSTTAVGLFRVAGGLTALDSAGTTSETCILVCRNSTPADRMYVLSDGYGYIHDAYGWHVGPSERKYKTNIVPIVDALDIIRKLKPSQFDYKDGRTNKVGFIAEDIQKVLPHLVSNAKLSGSEDFLAIATTGLIPYYAAAFQEIDARLTALETKN